MQGVIFAGISGSAIADVAGIGRIVIKMMTTDNRYPGSYAAAITAASAVIAPIIPPSIPMVLFALVSDASIGFLFLGGVVPGLMIGVGLMLVNAVVSRRRDFPVEPGPPAREWPRIFIGAFPALMIPVILLLGIRAGVMTPTEAAAVAAVYAYLISLILYRSISVRDTYHAILASARSTASIGMLIAGALAFNYVVTVENMPQTVSRVLSSYELSQTTFLIAVNVILLVLGCLLEGSTILLVIVPILVPAAKALGIDLVHFGVVVVFNIMVGLITPPYGLLLFIVSNIARVPLKDIVLQEIPFIVIMLLALAIITFVPETVLWLPRLAGYKGDGVMTRIVSASAEDSVVRGNGFLVIWSDVPSEHEMDYLHWLTREHTFERLGVDGFLGVRVYRALRSDVCRYFIHYRLTAAAVLASAPYVERLNAPTPWSQRIMPILGNFARGGGRVAAEVGQGYGGVLAAIKLAPLPEDIHDDKLASIAASDRIIAARLLETDLDRTSIATREKGIRAGDEVFAGVLLIEGLDELAVSAAVARHGFDPPGELYAEIFQL
jgi:tripartite ATP-independent transporter DctM subunit